VTSFSRRWGGLDVGATLHLLYRQLDQDGMGMRADAMAQYTFGDRYRVGALLKGLIPSTARWESGEAEYENTDLQLAAAMRVPAPYFYGTLQIAGQTEGLFQKKAKSSSKLAGDRPIESVADGLAVSNVGVEFLFDFGLALRAGLNEVFAKRDLAAQSAFGLGYSWRGIAGLDYSFTPHPDLLPSHRLSLQFTPVFPKFNGRDYRHASARGAGGKPAQRASPSPSSGQAGPEAAGESPEAAPDEAAPPAEKSAPAEEVLEEE
jgi:hypothetical protein